MNCAEVELLRAVSTSSLIGQFRRIAGIRIPKEYSEDDIRLGFLEPFVGCAEVFRSAAGDDFIAREGEIAKDQVMVGVLGVNESFQPT